MRAIQITLPDDLQSFVEAEAAANGYDSPGAFVQGVLRSLWKQKARARLEERLVAATESEPAIEATPDFWADLKVRVRRRAGIETS